MGTKKNYIVHILLATYNGNSYISQLLDSILNQSYKYWYLLIHDDGSTDGTVETIKSYQKKYPDQIGLIEDSHKFGSAKDNFAYLLSRTKADYIMFCDQDDIWLEDKVKITLDSMLDEESKSPMLPILVHTDLKVVNDDLELISDSMFAFQKLPKVVSSIDDILIRNNVTGCTVMVNRNAVDVATPLSNKAMMHDWWIAAKVLSKGGKIHFVDTPTILYRQHAKNSVGAVKINFWYFFKKIFLILVLKSDFTMMKVLSQAKAIDKNISTYSLIIKKIKSVGRIALFGSKS